MEDEAAKIDKAKARSIAENSQVLKSYAKYANITLLYDVYFAYIIDSVNCTAPLNEVNVSYLVSNLGNNVKEDPLKIITIMMDPKLENITKLREDTAIYAGSSYYSSNWAGYSFYGNSSATIPLYESKTTYIMPVVSKPISPSDACRVDLGKKKCMLMIWTGLTDTYTGNKISQGGSVVEVECTSSTTCNTKYYLFFEFYPQPAATCESNPPYNGGDSMTVTVTNKAKSGGSNTKYNIMVLDNTIGSGCGIFDYDFADLPSPYYGAFINERPAVGSYTNYQTLAKFTYDTMTGWVYYNGSTKSIYTPYSNAWYNRYTMQNGGYTNITISNVDISGSFTATYVTSNGT